MQRSQDSDTKSSDPPDRHAALHRGFRWQVDEHFNIAEACCSGWAEAGNGTPSAIKKIAVRAHQTGASATSHTLFELNEYPKEIELIDAPPTTTTGKVQRRVLRLQEEQFKSGKLLKADA